MIQRFLTKLVMGSALGVGLGYAIAYRMLTHAPKDVASAPEAAVTGARNAAVDGSKEILSRLEKTKNNISNSTNSNNHNN
eukprot:jgi/Hompol1/5529/HPOL_004508-RA